MTILSDFLKLIRFKNLVIIVLTQLLVKYVLINPFSFKVSLNNFDFCLLALSTLLIAAAGNIINDYFDIKVDRLNNRNVIIGQTIKRRSAIALHISFSAIGIFIGFYLAWKVGIITLGFINLFCAISLWYYSTNLKRKPISGNVLVATLSALVLIVVPLYDLIPEPGVNISEIFNTIVLYSLFAFFFSFIREIIKDLEDYQGDKKSGMKTFAIAIGVDRTKTVLKVLTFMILCSFIYLLTITFATNLHSFIYLLLMLTIPLSTFLVLLFKSKTKEDFYVLSTLLKLIMVAGILSMFII
jgi:4-hydroxybenzoate polyprenyltransferase